MATSIHPSIHPCLVSFLFIPSLYSLFSIERFFIYLYGCRDAPCKKSCKQGYPLGNTIKDTSTIMRNPLPELCRGGLRMIVLVSLIVLLRGYPCLHDFLHGASLHPYSFIFPLVSHIFQGFARIGSYAHAYMRSAAHLSRVSLVKWRRSTSHTLGS